VKKPGLRFGLENPVAMNANVGVGRVFSLTAGATTLLANRTATFNTRRTSGRIPLAAFSTDQRIEFITHGSDCKQIKRIMVIKEPEP
jgi:hypothetical protein